VIDLALSVVANCLFGLVDGEGKYEVGLSPYAIDNQPALGIVHHVAKATLGESFVGLLDTVVVFAIREGTHVPGVPVLEDPVIVRWETYRRVGNPGFHGRLPTAIRFHVFVWPLVPAAVYVLVTMISAVTNNMG
jgi:hypothetical protein